MLDVPAQLIGKRIVEILLRGRWTDVKQFMGCLTPPWVKPIERVPPTQQHRARAPNMHAQPIHEGMQRLEVFRAGVEMLRRYPAAAGKTGKTRQIEQVVREGSDREPAY